jgi:hypothetical protein
LSFSAWLRIHSNCHPWPDRGSMFLFITGFPFTWKCKNTSGFQQSLGMTRKIAGMTRKIVQNDKRSMRNDKRGLCGMIKRVCIRHLKFILYPEKTLFNFHL